MILLTVNHVSKAFVTRSVLEDASLVLQTGQRMGVVGVNGSGKSTLFRMIAGELEPDAGSITLLKGARVGMLTQQADITSDYTVQEELERVFEPVRRMEARLREMEEQMAALHHDAEAFAQLSRDYSRLMDRFEDAGGYEWPSRIQGVLAGLGFADDKRNQKAALLSGGEKTRLCLARLLLTQPELLMLDEPTNHLDLASTQWLEDTLRKYRGSVMVISHDRYFMNSVCDCMAEVCMRRIDQYEGNYDQFAQKRQANLERRLKEYKMQQAEIARQQAIIARYRMYNTERSIRAAESREKQLDKIERVEKPVSEQKVRFSFGARRRSGDDVLMVKNLEKGFGSRTLFSGLNLHLRAGDRVAVIGQNGVGKSTLLNLICGLQKPDSGQILFGSNVDVGYYDQQQSALHPEKDIMSEVWDDFPWMEPGDVRAVLALFLFTGEEVFKRISTLSGGERGRVALAKLMLKKDNLLLLDEPTNHLDMDSREVLEDALNDYEGTLLTVSHDRYFINRVANRVLEMTPQGAKDYLGNYDDYLEKKRQEEMGLLEEAAPGMTRTQMDKEKRKQRLKNENKKQLLQRLKDTEAAIPAAEEAIARLEAQMGDPEIYKDGQKAAQVAREHEQMQQKLDALYEEWEELTNAAESFES
ncbi:MAG: ABC-F family ATP-binding cassette domain-containing protein [Eubacteriales bacterium]|nr:ABC-F family ATP-binding cassette domain-containing protein [Eubacteriales bacterium]